MRASEFMGKLINVRTAILKRGVCGKDVALTSESLRKVKTWYETWRPTDEQCRNYIKNHYQEIRFLMPGGKVEKTWLQNLQSIIQ